jgi:hypothetical protein
MKPARTKYAMDSVLSYSVQPKSRATVRSYYERWRAERGIALGCDNAGCRFFDGNLEWNGKRLPLILDHENGHSIDNRPENLRFLCPNCDAQLPTRGGRNIGRIQKKSAGGFEVVHRDGRRDVLVAVMGVAALPLATLDTTVKASGSVDAQQPVAADGEG